MKTITVFVFVFASYKKMWEKIQQKKYIYQKEEEEVENKEGRISKAKYIYIEINININIYIKKTLKVMYEIL